MLRSPEFQISGEQVLKVNIPGYDFISQPSLSSYGGVWSFVSNNLNLTVRNKIFVSKPDHDSLWIEVQSDLHHNVVCGVIYRNHNSDIDTFLAH